MSWQLALRVLHFLLPIVKRRVEARLAARYACTRCGKSEVEARAQGCSRGPCPMLPLGPSAIVVAERLEILRRIAESAQQRALQKRDSEFTDVFQHWLNELALLRKELQSTEAS